MSGAGPTYGIAAADVAAAAEQGPSVLRTVWPLLVLVIGLAAATVWFLAAPALEPEPAKRSCEVIVLESGATKCVANPASASRRTARSATAG